MSRLYPPRRIAQIWLLIGSVGLLASASELVAHFLFGVEIVDKSTGAPASTVSVIVGSAFFGAIGSVFAFAGWRLLLAMRRTNSN
jgi:hypothetical protein